MDIINRFARNKEKGSYYYSKYKKTHKNSYKRKANRSYARAEACAIKLGRKKSTTNNFNFSYKSNNKTKTSWFPNLRFIFKNKNSKKNKN